MEQLNKQLNLSFKVLTFSLIIWFVFTSVLKYGIFMDGMGYSAVSYQISEGNGDLWHLQLSKTYDATFYGHPPLAIYLHSLLYKLFDNFIVDKLYSFLLFLLNCFGIVLIWKLIHKSDKIYAQNYWWIPVLLYISIPLIPWAFKNNMLENTMSFFSLLSVYYILKSILSSKIIYLLLGSFFIFISFLCKGFPGLFPLALPFFYYLFFKNKMSFKKTIWFSFILVTTLGLLFVLLSFNNDANLYFATYFDIQIKQSLSGNRGVDENRFFIVTKILSELIPIFIVFFIVKVIHLKIEKELFVKSNFKKLAFLFLIIALSASLPILISPQQSGFYALCSFPHYAIFFSLLILPVVSKWIENKTSKLLYSISLLSVIVAFIFSISNYKKFSRDEEIISDVFIIKKIIPKGEIVSIPDEQFECWSNYSYFSRYGFISLDVVNKNHRFFLYDPVFKGKIPTNFTKVKLKLKRFELYANTNYY